jgi:hypothetical protein
MAEAALRRSSYHAVHHLVCDCDGGVITLRGRVPSFFLKQVAQNVVHHRLQALVTVKNLVEVC